MTTAPPPAADSASHDEAGNDEANLTDTLAETSSVVDRWKAKLDELRVQGDLASMDARAELTKKVEVAENVYLAVRSRLNDARHDAAGGMDALRQTFDELLTDLQRAYDDAEAVIRRSNER